MKVKKNFLRKALCMVMSFIITVSVFMGFNINISAGTNGITQEQAGAWAEAQNGKSLDQDGYYGAQCVDLIRYYYLYLGNSPVQGNGCDYATNALPSGWQRIRYYNGFVPQRGDIAVWTYTTSSYGHVAIVTNADSSKFYVVEQNGSTHITRMWSYNYSYGTLWGFIRPDFASPANNPEISPIIYDDKNAAVVNEEITFGYSGLKICTKVVFCFMKENEVYYSIDSTSSNTITTYFEHEGKYEVYVRGYFNGVWYDSEKITVYIFDPSISADKQIVCVGETINFTYEGLMMCSKASFEFSNDNYVYYSVDSTSSRNFTTYFENEGIYYVNAVGYKNGNYCRSDKIKIEVLSHNYVSTVTTQPTCTQTGVKTYKCTACGETIKTENIPATGHTPGDWEVETEATANYDGLEVIRCTVCTEILEERAIPKLSGATPGTLYLDKKPTKISYDLNEEFDPTGAVLRVKYNDGTIKSLSSSDVQIVGFDTTTGGNKKVHFSYTENGVTLNTWEFTILVDRQVTAIFIPHKPNKTHYICGEAFEREGMQIIATYSDGTKADVTAEVRTSGYDSLTFGLKKMTVSYTYKGKTVTLQFSYEMNPKLTGLVLTHKPNKLGTYKVGEPLSKEGMIITAKFSDGSTKDVTHLIRTSGYSSKQVGKQIITVSYTYGTQTKKVQFSIIMSE